MRAIGIDPGIATTGYGVVEASGGRLVALDHGIVRTPTRASAAERLSFLYDALGRVFARAGADVAAVERVFFSTNVKTAMAVGQASGIALACAAAHGLAVADYTPLEVKQSVVGVGSASKQQVQAMVASVLGLAERPSPDAADACALAICHLNRSRFDRAVAAAEAAR